MSKPDHEKTSTGTAQMWWKQAQDRLSNPAVRRVEISIAARDVTSSITRIDKPGYVCGWEEDHLGNHVTLGIEAIHRARRAVNVLASSLGWVLVEDNAESQVFERAPERVRHQCPSCYGKGLLVEGFHCGMCDDEGWVTKDGEPFRKTSA